MTAKAIVHVTEVVTVMVEMRAPKTGELGWSVPKEATPEEALDHVLVGRDEVNCGEYGYGWYATSDHNEFDPDYDLRDIVVHVRRVSEIRSAIRNL